MRQKTTGAKKARAAKSRPGTMDYGEAKKDLTIAAIGASAGGIEAFSELVGESPSHAGMAFVLVQRLDPKQQSLLAELPSKKTSVTVLEVRDGMTVEPDHVYVIPPDATMSIRDHTRPPTKRTISLSANSRSRQRRMPEKRLAASLTGNPGVGPSLLSLRETEVVQHLAAGRSNKEIAALLRLSTRTVETYRARVMVKLRLHTLADLVRYAVRQRLIEV